MGAEYVRLSYPEKLFGQKNLLFTELEILTSLKRLSTYKELRKKELLLKIAVKSKIAEVMENLKILDKMLPHVHVEKKQKETEPSSPKKIIEEKKEEPKGTGIEAELEMIRSKISSLQTY